LDNNARTNTFGASSLLKVKNHPEVSVKTGTTNEKRDNWVLGYTPSFLVAAWVGNNNNQSMGRLASGVTGATPIWNKIMSFVLEKQDRQKGKLFQEWLTRPEGVTGASICALSGLAPGDSNCPTRYEYFINGTVPSETESLRRSILINKETGQPVQSGRNYPPEKTEVQERQQVLTDLTGSILCLDCPFPTEPAIFEAQRLKTPF
jgi:membrane carboxypeptidase/penicillin-binding protein